MPCISCGRERDVDLKPVSIGLSRVVPLVVVVVEAELPALPRARPRALLRLRGLRLKRHLPHNLLAE